MTISLNNTDLQRAVLFGVCGAVGAIVGNSICELLPFQETPPQTLGEAIVLFWIHTGIWNALLGAGVSSAIVLAEAYFQRRTRPNGGTLARAIIAGLLVGGVAGVIAQTLFMLPQFFPVPPEAEFVVTEIVRVFCWAVLGLLTALGVAGFIPNLPRSRAGMGGGIGGGLGGITFILASAVGGEVLGRTIGVAFIGFGIAVMIAAADILLREAWLEVSYGPREVRRISLGPHPVLLGGDRERCTIVLAQAAPVAAEYRFDAGNIVFKDRERGTSTTVSVGHRHLIGKVEIIVCGKVRGASPPPPKPEQSGWLLQVGGRRIPLSLGVRLLAADLPGCTDKDGNQLAEVVANPQHPGVLGLKNLTRRGWNARMPSGETREIAPGQSIRLAAGVRIRFGACEGTIEAA